jgi:hypothetical protein
MRFPVHMMRQRGGEVRGYSGHQITVRIKEKQRFKPRRVLRALRIKVSVIALLILSIIIVSLLIAWYPI